MKSRALQSVYFVCLLAFVTSVTVTFLNHFSPVGSAASSALDLAPSDDSDNLLVGFYQMLSQ